MSRRPKIQAENIKKKENSLSDLEKGQLLNLHKALIDKQISASAAFDKTLLTLSTAMLGFSFAFVGYKMPNLHNLVPLYFCWFFLFVVIILMLVSFWADQKDSKNEIKRYQGEQIKKMPCVKCLMIYLPRIAAFFFIVALILFTIFVSTNI